MFSTIEIELLVILKCIKKQQKLYKMTQIRQKRIKLDNGKTVIVDIPAKNDKKDPFKEVVGLLRGVKNVKPCD